MAADGVDALVIFGATGDLAKLETFPALVGLVQRGVLDVPIVGVAKSGWGLDQFRDYAAASLKLNNMDPYVMYVQNHVIMRVAAGPIVP
jgi:glucose-6-phosphate 1-dehydrogenase